MTPPTTRSRRASRREAINERLSVDLYVCPTCSNIGKLPAGKFSAHCTGPRGSMHKRVRMEARRFEEAA